MPPKRISRSALVSKRTPVISSANGAGSKTQETCSCHSFSSSEVEILRKELLSWYDSCHRKLPWRDIVKTEEDINIKGYSVWVSEIMLQQTQVATVIDYYKKWMKKWPTVNDLAAAAIDEVLQVWSGLGYYQRARRLHEGASKISKELSGKMPTTPEELMNKIPGIGRYTASAISSITFGHVTGAVDGNAIRVLSRMRLIGAPVSSSVADKALWALADQIVSSERPGDFNQAIMELGATVCTPQNPSCSTCPVRSVCLAYQKEKRKSLKTFQHGLSGNIEIEDIESVPGCALCLNHQTKQPDSNIVTLYPYKLPKKAARKEDIITLVLINKNKYLMQQRSKGALLEGLWEFPNAVCDKKEDKVIREILESVVREDDSRPHYLGDVVHIFSHIHATYKVYTHSLSSDKILSGQWMSKTEIESSAISTAMRKVFSFVVRGGSSNKTSEVQKKRSASQSRQTTLNFKVLKKE